MCPVTKAKIAAQAWKTEPQNHNILKAMVEYNPTVPVLMNFRVWVVIEKGDMSGHQNQNFQQTVRDPRGKTI